MEPSFDKALQEGFVGNPRRITPFGAQTQAIVQACTALGIKTGKGDGEMTVGTVHSFQGAERPVVIFSAVYSKHADGEFIDRKDSMLNVAASGQGQFPGFW